MEFEMNAHSSYARDMLSKYFVGVVVLAVVVSITTPKTAVVEIKSEPKKSSLCLVS